MQYEVYVQWCELYVVCEVYELHGPYALLRAACLQKLYELVVRHFLACVSQPAIGFETTVDADIAGEGFVARGLMITEVRGVKKLERE